MINEIMTKPISKICCIIKSGFISELNIYLRCDLIIEAQILGVIEMITPFTVATFFKLIYTM